MSKRSGRRKRGMWRHSAGLLVKPLTSKQRRRARAALLRRDGDACCYCGCQMWPDDCSIEHIKSWSEGGTHDLDNLALCHQGCNERARKWSVGRKRAVMAMSRVVEDVASC